MPPASMVLAQIKWVGAQGQALGYVAILIIRIEVWMFEFQGGFKLHS